MSLTRRTFVGLTAGVTAHGLLAAEVEKPYLKVGFMTDTHVDWRKTSCARVKGAFSIFRAHNVDAIGHCGDLADWHYPDAYKYYLETYNEVYAGCAQQPKLLYVFGNHDALDPTRKDPKLRQSRMMDLATAFALMRERLHITHDLFYETTLNGVPFLVFPQSPELIGGYKVVEEKLDAACLKHPTGPIVVLTHMPPANTLYNSGEWGAPRLRAIFDKYPRIISFTGHTHGSLRNEQSIWQGAFTAVDVCCLQEWHGISVGTPVRGKQAYGVLIAEFYSNRLVLRRFDVRDGSEFKPEAPWCVPLPFTAATAPYAPQIRRKAEQPGLFPANAQITLTPDATPFSQVAITFPGVQNEADVLAYKVELEHKENGTWRKFARGDVFSGFYQRPSDRPATYTRTFFSAYFDAGKTYRIVVTPVGFFGTCGNPLKAEWTAPDACETEVVFHSENPMQQMDCRRGWPRSAADRAKASHPAYAEGWYRLEGGSTWLNFPADTWQGDSGTRFRVIVDLALRQPANYDGHCLRLTTPDGTSRSASAWMTMPSGNTPTLRCVFAFTTRGTETPDYALTLTNGHLGQVRFDYVRVEKLLPRH